MTRSAGGHSFYFQRADVEFDLPDTGLEQVHQEGEEEEACSDPFHCNWSSTAAHTHTCTCVYDIKSYKYTCIKKTYKYVERETERERERAHGGIKNDMTPMLGYTRAFHIYIYTHTVYVDI